eukprot:TRINITY_DN60313_c0_g1_i1.p1 TRINITY_DN60313_c0_g1~~TRINITY_DN60313_c0_g1_i1.p1  ORF type:complete len:167 (+),score=22.74 TRINITY_DN60313_c0_g1_i1:63-563(+)
MDSPDCVAFDRLLTFCVCSGCAVVSANALDIALVAWIGYVLATTDAVGCGVTPLFLTFMFAFSAYHVVFEVFVFFAGKDSEACCLHSFAETLAFILARIVGIVGISTASETCALKINATAAGILVYYAVSDWLAEPMLLFMEAMIRSFAREARKRARTLEEPLLRA